MTSKPAQNSASVFHSKLIRENGVDDATGYSSDGQLQRFEAILRHFFALKKKGVKRYGASLLDYGCNVGDFLSFAKRNHWFFDYTGVDMNSQFINRLRERFGKRPKLACATIMEPCGWDFIQEHGPYDYVIASGTFCYRDQQVLHEEMLRRLWQVTRGMMCVNFLSTHSQCKNYRFHAYYDPSFGAELAEKLNCDSFNVDHLYRRNDFTVTLFR